MGTCISMDENSKTSHLVAAKYCKQKRESDEILNCQSVM